jgi:vitamin B12 transporter
LIIGISITPYFKCILTVQSAGQTDSEFVMYASRILPMKTFISTHILSPLLILTCLFAPAAHGEEVEDTMGLYSSWEEQSVSTGRASKPLSHTPENVTVITSKDIESLNAHTLADVLATIPGIQLENLSGPGGSAYTNVQGSKFNHVRVLVDGVALNNLVDNFPDVGLVPARVIERIEIVKGAASSVWGQALGGVINVITKAPEHGRLIGGSASAGIGKRATADSGAELSGTSDRLGYFLSGGYLGSNGLLPNTRFFSNNLYGKLIYDLYNHGQLSATLNYTNADRGEFEFSPFKADDTVRYRNATLGYRTDLTQLLAAELVMHHTSRRVEVTAAMIDSGDILQNATNRETATGADVKLIWRTTDNLLVAGGDYEHADFTLSNGALVQADELERTVDRWGAYLNNTLTIGALALSTGARFDHTQSGGDQFSPSLGATWQISDTTLLRGYTAKGFSLPALALDRTAEKVWTSQLGIESSVIPYLWMKETVFRNDTWDVTAYNPENGESFSERRITLGSETEARTFPLYNTSLGIGYTFTDTTRSSDASPVKGIPRHTVQLALRYDDLHLLRGVLTGRHIWWNSDPADQGSYGGMIWDLHLGATLFRKEQNSLELFFSGHNLFNSSQYTNQLFPTPDRWFEGGLKVRF